MSSAWSQNINMSTDLASSGGPNFSFKRGLAITTYGNDQATKERITRAADLGLQMVALAHNLIVHENAEGANSRENMFERPEWQFRILPDGNIATLVDDDVTQVRQYAHERGLEIIYQISGAPYRGYISDSRKTHYYIPVLSMKESREWNGGANWYPVPKKRV